MHNFRELKIWQVAMDISKEVFLITKEFPKEELYSLTSQINRSAISIPSNIAEGSSRSTDKAFIQFLDIALGSSYELETQLILSYSCKYINEQIFNKIIENINQLQKMIVGFKRTLNKS